MDVTLREKEVFFDQYCCKCVHKSDKEDQKKCHFCLKSGKNWNSHKPVGFVENRQNRKNGAKKG